MGGGGGGGGGGARMIFSTPTLVCFYTKYYANSDESGLSEEPCW